MTDPAIENFDLHIVRAGIAAIEAKRNQGRLGAMSGISANLDHVMAPCDRFCSKPPNQIHYLVGASTEICGSRTSFAMTRNYV
jgi:hypothetical protein